MYEYDTPVATSPETAPNPLTTAELRLDACKAKSATITNDSTAQEVFDILQESLAGNRELLIERNCPRSATIFQSFIDKNHNAWNEMLADPDPKYQDELFRRGFVTVLCEHTAKMSELAKYAALLEAQGLGD